VWRKGPGKYEVLTEKKQSARRGQSSSRGRSYTPGTAKRSKRFKSPIKELVFGGCWDCHPTAQLSPSIKQAVNASTDFFMSDVLAAIKRL